MRDWLSCWEESLITGGLRAFKPISLQLTNTECGPVGSSLGSPSQPLETPLAVTLKHQTDKWIIRVVPPWTLLHELYRILIIQQYLIKHIWSSAEDLQMFDSLKMNSEHRDWLARVRNNPLVAVKFCCDYWLWGLRVSECQWNLFIVKLILFSSSLYGSTTSHLSN